MFNLFTNLILVGCFTFDPMSERAKYAALVCYDNGSLAYASETTVTELAVLVENQKECKKNLEAAVEEYRLETNNVCSLPEGHEGIRIRDGFFRFDTSAEMRECATNRKLGVPKKDCKGYIPPRITKGSTSFVDGNTYFYTETLSCMSRTSR